MILLELKNVEELTSFYKDFLKSSGGNTITLDDIVSHYERNSIKQLSKEAIEGMGNCMYYSATKYGLIPANTEIKELSLKHIIQQIYTLFFQQIPNKELDSIRCIKLDDDKFIPSGIAHILYISFHITFTEAQELAEAVIEIFSAAKKGIEFETIEKYFNSVIKNAQTASITKTVLERVREKYELEKWARTANNG